MEREERIKLADVVRARTGHITATEILLLRGDPVEEIEQHVMPYILPILCGPMGRVIS